MADNIKEDDLILCNACLCCNTSLFFTMPDLIGCSGSRECLCLHDAFCIKSGTDPYGIGMVDGEDGDICNLALYCCKCGLNSPRTCCKSQGQCLCLVSAAALPPTEDIPMFCSLFTIACYPSFGVFKTQGELKK